METTEKDVKQISKKRLVVIGLAIILVILFLIASTSDRNKSNVEITIPKPGSIIFLDSTQRDISVQENEVFSYDLKRGGHSIIVAKQGHWPWGKDFLVEEGKKISLHPFLIAQEEVLSISEVNPADTDYLQIINSIRSFTTPTEERPLASDDESYSLWVIGTEVLYKSADSNRSVVIFDSLTQITGLSFFLDRNDVVIVSTDDNVYALETDTVNTQNFQPIYEGVRNVGHVVRDNTLYILDQDTLFEVDL